jgi:hypothetical protein
MYSTCAVLKGKNYFKSETSVTAVRIATPYGLDD